MNLKILGALALIAIIAAVIVLLPKEKKVESRVLFPELNLEKLNQVTKVNVQSNQENIELTRDAARGWILPQLDGYPADGTKIRQLLRTFLEAEKLEKKTSDSAYYTRLGVDDPKNSKASNTLVSLTADAFHYDLILGNFSSQLSQGQYVRKLDEDESWLINRRFNVSKILNEWLDTQILHLEREDILQIKINDQSSGKLFEIIRDNSSDKLQLKHDSNDKKELPESDVNFRINQFVSVVDYMKFKQLWSKESIFASAESKKSTPPSEPIVAEYTTLDKMIITIDAYQRLEKDLFEITATSADDATMEAKEKARQIAVLTENRIYEMPDASYNALTNSTKEILELLNE